MSLTPDPVCSCHIFGVFLIIRVLESEEESKSNPILSTMLAFGLCMSIVFCDTDGDLILLDLACLMIPEDIFAAA